MENKKVVLLLSGGIDSVTLLYYLLNANYQVYPLYINYGQRNRDAELNAIKNVVDSTACCKLEIINVSNIGEIGSGTLVGDFPADIDSSSAWYKKEFFPNRNLMLLTIASTYCSKVGIHKVAIGTCGTTSYSDTKGIFIDKCEELIKISIDDDSFRIMAPFTDKDREIVIREAKKLKVKISSTYSCNTGNNPCQLCSSCRDHNQAITKYRELKY